MSKLHEIEGPIYVAGHRGMVGSAIVRALEADGLGSRLVTATHAELDLRDKSAVDAFFEAHRPAFVFLAAATVGGIAANSRAPARFIYDNLLIETHVIDAAYRFGCKKLLFLGSSCIYPKFAPQPIPEDALLTGPLEITNQSYALAKIAGIELCRAYRVQYGFDAISVMPTNLYGPGDQFDLTDAHVLPALMRRIDEAKRAGQTEVQLWGTGRAIREFLHVDDLARACLLAMNAHEGTLPLNIGSGEEVTIAELAERLRRVIGADIRFTFDPSAPDGTPRKLLDCTTLRNLGFVPQISLDDGLQSTYAWYLAHRDHLRGGSRISA